MDFSFTAEDEAFRDELRAWLDVEPPQVPRDLGRPTTIRAAAGRRLRPHPGEAQGLAAAARTTAAGPPSTGPRTGTAARPRRCRTRSTPRRWRGCSAPGIYNANGIWQIGPMIIKWGTPEQQQRWLPVHPHRPTSTGARASASPRPAPTSRTCARWRSLDGDNYVVNGQKTWISSAHLAKWGLFLLRTDPTAFERGAKHEGITAFIIDMDTPGIECRPIRDITGDTMLNEVCFTDAVDPGRLPARRRGRGLAGRDEHARPRARRHRGPVDHDGRRTCKSMISAAHVGEPGRAATTRELRDRIGARVRRHRAHPAPQLPGAHQDHEGSAELARGPARQAAVVEDQPDARRARGRPARHRPACSPRAAPTRSTAAPWARNYSWQRYTSIGAGATEIQKNIIAKKALRMRSR